MSRRRRGARGFAMIDALVSIAVAALTLSLLTSASWGLKISNDRRAVLEATSSADWLLARRTLQTWVGDASNEGSRAAGASLFGTATTLRMIVRDRALAQSFVGEFRVEGTADSGYSLIAARHGGLNDARIVSDDPLSSVLLVSDEPVRFIYLFQDDRGNDIWRYETGDGSSLPRAVGVEVGDMRRLTLPVFATLSQSCFSQLGPSALEGERCEVR